MTQDGASDIDHEPTFAWQAIRGHFGEAATRNLISLRRQFSDHLRADIQAAIDDRLKQLPHTLFGVFQEHEFFKMGAANLLNRQPDKAITISPPQYQDIDVGRPSRWPASVPACGLRDPATCLSWSWCPTTPSSERAL